MTQTILTIAIRFEQDVVLARQRARQLAELLGLDAQEQTRLATAVSEIARNVYQYAAGGTVAFELAAEPLPALRVQVRDVGPGIANLEDVLDGRYVSRTGMGLGIIGARRLSDRFEIESTPGVGTTVVITKLLQRRGPAVTAHQLAAELARRTPQDALGEIRQQNQELLGALEQLRQRQAEIERLNRELEETNRGVLALYAELDEKAQDLARASELKSRFLSNITHELRTPLNAVLNVARLLLGRLDGPLTAEQERQVRLIHGAATTLSDMVNDLLDLGRIEAGRTVVRPTEFTVADLFGTLRGMFRPVATSEAVALVFDDVGDLPPLVTDDGKVAQILRNFTSNALKFTEQGTVRVSAAATPDGQITFSVSDTGIGIAPEDQERIFEEFSQLEHPLQMRAVGSGLGLPLSRKLAQLLGGTVGLHSEPGVGSTFYATIPMRYSRQGGPIPPGATLEVQHA